MLALRSFLFIQKKKLKLFYILSSFGLHPFFVVLFSFAGKGGSFVHS